MKRLLIVLLVFLFSLPQLKAFGDQNLQKGWDAFAQNRYSQAETYFKRATSGNYKAEAYLSLVLVGSATNNDDLATQSMYEFFQISSNPEPYLDALWWVWHGTNDSELMIKFLNELTQSENGGLQAKANIRLGHHYRRANQHSKAAAHFEQIGAVTQWQVLGEFENISESGFDKDFGAVNHPEKKQLFTNKYGASVQWFDIKAAQYNGWVDLEYFFGGSNSIIYSQTFCTSPVDQEVYFRMGVAGSLKVWVNDQLMFTEAEERDNGMDTYIFSVKLMKGNNRILIQTGSSEVDDHNFMLRITDLAGIPIEGLVFSTTHRSYARDYNYQSTEIPLHTEVYFMQQLEKYPDALFYHLLMNRVYLSSEKTFLALNNLKASRKKFPECSYLTMQAIWAYQQDNNRTELSKCLEEIKRTDPDYPPAQTELFNEAIAVKNYKEVREIIANMEKQDPYSIAVYSRKISLALEEEEYEELIELVMDAYKQHPNHYEFVNLRYLIEKDIKNNNKGAIKIMKRYLKRNYNESAISTLTNAYLGLGQLSNALKLFHIRITNNPIGVGTYYSLAQLYFQLGDYHKAEEVINECIKLAPYIGSYHVFLGDIFSERKQTFKAREAYETGINLYPQNYEAREKLRKIKGMDDIFDTFEKIDVYKAFEEAPVADDYPDDNSILLIDAVQTVIYPGGGSQEKHTLVAKVFDTKGVDTWKEFTIPVYNNQSAIVEKMEVLKKNGSRIEAERSGAYVVFPNLEEGDAIHLTWKVSNYYSGVLARNFWAHQYFSYMIPVKHTSYSLLVPADLDFNYVQHNLDIEPAITTQGSNKLYVWTTENTPAHKDERYMPRTAEIGSMLYLSSFSSWQEIADWYADLAHAKAKVDFQVTETVEDLFTGKEDLSDMDKVKEIYGFILRNIRYSSVPFLQSALIPRKASRTLSQGQGDCKDVSTLFVAMCKAVGIEATIVLVNSRENGASTMPLPEIGFNHAIAKVELDGKEYYVELTSDNLPFAAGHESLKQAFALSIPLDRTNPLEAGLIDPVTRMSNDLVRECKVTFEGELMRVDKQTWRTGVEAAYFRDIYRDLGNERKEQRMQEMITRQYPKIKLTGLTFNESLHNLEDTLYYTYSYEVPDIFTEVGKMQIFELPWSDKFDSPPFMATEEREFAIELWAYLDVEKYQEKLIIDIPAGKRLADLPKNVNISCENATYALTFRKSGNQVIVDRLLTITNDRVLPEDYAAFRQFLGDVVRADKQQLGFTSGR